jgi:ribonuclease HII
MSAYEPPSLERIEVACDEAGRGCLYGDVVAAAVILPPYEPWMDQLKDSKQVSVKCREALAKTIKEQAVAFGIGTATAKEIDQMNILRASLKAMHRALDQVAEKAVFEHILVDGPHFRPYTCKEEDGEPIYIPYTCIPGGDGIKMSIAAASILAKTYRDQWVIQQVQEDPSLEKYGLVNHKGYGTLKHMMALQLYGPDKNHRFSFAPVTANMR